MFFKQYFQKAIKSMQKALYLEALMYFSLLLKGAKNLSQKELKIILIYTDIANLSIKDAQIGEKMFEYFTYSVLEDHKNVSQEKLKAFEDVLTNMQARRENNAKIIKKELDDIFLNEKAISYEEFIQILNQSDDFKSTFASVMHSTKVLISKKEDFANFIDLLAQNGYTEMALSYLESALSIFPNDLSFNFVADRFTRQSS